MGVIQVAFVHCNSTGHIVNNGKAHRGTQCILVLPNKPGAHEYIVNMALNSYDVKGACLIFRISTSSVISNLKNRL